MRFKYFIPVLASAALLLTACDDVFTPAIENFKDIDMVNKEPDFAKTSRTSIWSTRSLILQRVS